MTVTATDVLKAELEKFGSADEARNLAFIKALCEAFEAKARQYYQAGASADDRLQRLAEISAAFREIKFKDGRREFTIAAKQVKPKTTNPTTASGTKASSAPAQVDYRCPTGTQCVDGNCVPVVGGEVS